VVIFLYLQWRLFVLDGFLESLDVLFLVVNLLHRLGQVTLEFGVGIRGLCDPLLERRVAVGPTAPHLIRTLSDQIVHVTSESLRGRSRTWTYKVGD
jgi:hypothetical protein